MTTYTDIRTRWKNLANLASGIIPSTLSLEPTPDEIQAMEEDIRLFARYADALVKAYAEYFIEHTGRMIDRQYTDDQLSGALEGNLLFEFEDEAETLRMDMREAANG